MAAHIYATDSQKVIDYLTDLHNTFGMNIWVTEFACHVRCLFFCLFQIITTVIIVELHWRSTLRLKFDIHVHEQPYTMDG